MILYHGTDIESAKAICKGCGIDLTRCSSKTDFGQGFYTTDDYDRAVRWANRKAILRLSKPAVVTVTFDENSAKDIIEYFADDLRWGRFVINNRNGLNYIRKVSFKDNNLDGRYDITCGRVADFDVLDVADELKQNGLMLDSVDKLFNPDYPQQIVFHTPEALSYIRKLSYRFI